LRFLIPRCLLIGLLAAAATACSTPRIEPGEGLVLVEGGTVWYKVFGTGSGTPLLMLHGGPGATSEVFEPLAKRLGRDRPVIIYDQLGAGRSRGPHDTKLWTEHRYVDEIRRIRKHLGLDRIHLYGHSWGTMLAMDYMATDPEGVESLILAGPCISIPRYLEDVNRLRRQLPQETQDILARHEAAGTDGSEEYMRAADVFYKRHVCRMNPWPREMTNSLENFGLDVYRYMWGPNEFRGTGTLKDYDRTADLRKLRLPVLFTAGRYDECTPEATAWYRGMVRGAKMQIFEHSAHMTMLEEPDAYYTTVRQFLQSVESQSLGRPSAGQKVTKLTPGSYRKET